MLNFVLKISRDSVSSSRECPPCTATHQIAMANVLNELGCTLSHCLTFWYMSNWQHISVCCQGYNIMSAFCQIFSHPNCLIMFLHFLVDSSSCSPWHVYWIDGWVEEPGSRMAVMLWELVTHLLIFPYEITTINTVTSYPVDTLNTTVSCLSLLVHENQWMFKVLFQRTPSISQCAFIEGPSQISIKHSEFQRAKQQVKEQSS